MSNSVLKDLLKEYDRKKIAAEKSADLNKKLIFEKYPELAEVEQKLNMAGIECAKSILTSNNSESIAELDQKIKDLQLEKTNLLNKFNISEDVITPNYECKKCNDTGYITFDSQTVMCACLKQKLTNSLYNKSNIYNLDKENFETFNLNLYSDKVDKEKYKSDISPRENILKIKNIVNNFITNFDDINEKNLLFTGNTGLGKTFFSNCIAKEIINKGKIVIYQTAPVMLDSIIDYRFGKNNVSEEYYNDLINCDLLIIDDLGTESINSLKFTELFNIINTRLLNQNNKSLKTIISTNLTLQNLFANYDERIVSRIVGYYNICRFFGDDIRFNKK